MYEMSEKEMKKIEKATLYELRLAISQSEKEEYTKKEILEMIDTIAIAKEQG